MKVEKLLNQENKAVVSINLLGMNYKELMVVNLVPEQKL